MVSLRVDASQLRGFGTAMAGSPEILRSELTTGVNAANVEGVGIMQEYVPFRDGNLRADVTVLQSAGVGDLTAAHGPAGIIYAAIQNFGGTVHGNPWLVFQIGGRWVKVRSVTIPATNYVGRTRDALRPRFQAAMQAAVDRAVARMGL